jgi:hypothetical protein
MELMPMLTPSSGTAQKVPGEAGHRVVHVAAVIEAGLEQHPAGADRFRILGDQRALLRRGGRWQQDEAEEGAGRENEARSRHQNVRRLSTRIVTGPSFTSSTCIIA